MLKCSAFVCCEDGVETEEEEEEVTEEDLFRANAVN